MMISILFATLLGLADAEPKVVIRSSGVAHVEYLAFLQAHPGLVSYSDYAIRSRVGKTAEADVRNRLAAAQAEFLKGELVAAREKFKSLHEIAMTQDWRSSERQAFAYAQLRLAQLATDEDTREKFLNEAARWGSADLQADLFPPPLWADYQKLLLSHATIEIPFIERFPLARYVLIDGKPIALLPGGKFETDKMDHRFTLVFDHRPPVTRVANWETVLNWNISNEELLAGDCSSPKWNLSTVKVDNAIGFFSMACQVEPPSSMTLKDVSATKSVPVASEFLFQPNQATTAKPFWKSGWFWGGSAVVAIIAYSMTQQKKATVPSTTEGF